MHYSVSISNLRVILKIFDRINGINGINRINRINRIDRIDRIRNNIEIL
jgi:hypothetical protein